MTEHDTYTAHPVNECGLIYGALAEGAHAGSEIADQLVACLDADSFTSPYRTAAWDAVRALRADGKLVTFGTLIPRMTTDGWTEGHDPMAEIIECSEYLMTSFAADREVFRSHMVTFAQHVLDAHVRRQIIVATEAGAKDAGFRGGPASEVLDVMTRRLDELTEYGLSLHGDRGKRRAERFQVALERRLEPESRASIKTPWPELNSVLGGGLVPGRLYVVAGRPAMGKSTLAWNLASWSALHERKGVRCVSYEEDVADVLNAMAASTAGVAKGGALTESQAEAVHHAMGRLSAAPIDVEEPGREHPFTLPHLLGMFPTWKAVGVELVVVDYLQLVPVGGRRQQDRRHEEVAEISRQLKRAALQHQLAVVVTAQLNRAVEARGNHRPALSDLRESGAIEQDADVVLLLFRPEYYHPDDADLEGEARVIVAKNRHGEAGRDVLLHFDGAMGRFSNPVSRWADPGNAPQPAKAPAVQWEGP